MEKIKSEEFDKLALHGRGNSSTFYNAMLGLKPGGDGLVIRKSEWGRSYPPTKMANRIAKKYGFVFKLGTLPDRSGWAVKRVS